MAGCLARHRGIDVASAQVAAQYRHNEQSLRVVDVLEDLNLTREVRNGIVCHTGRRKASTPEGRIITLPTALPISTTILTMRYARALSARAIFRSI